MQMLEMDGSKRPASMAGVKQELQNIAAQQRMGKAGTSLAAGVQNQPASSVPPVVTFSIQGVTLYMYRRHHMGVRAVAWSPDRLHIPSATTARPLQHCSAPNQHH